MTFSILLIKIFVLALT